MSFNNEGHSTDTTLFKYVLKVKRTLKIMPSLKWYIIKSVPAYSKCPRENVASEIYNNISTVK